MTPDLPQLRQHFLRPPTEIQKRAGPMFSSPSPPPPSPRQPGYSASLLHGLHQASLKLGTIHFSSIHCLQICSIRRSFSVPAPQLNRSKIFQSLLAPQINLLLITKVHSQTQASVHENNQSPYRSVLNFLCLTKPHSFHLA